MLVERRIEIYIGSRNMVFYGGSTFLFIGLRRLHTAIIFCIFDPKQAYFFIRYDNLQNGVFYISGTSGYGCKCDILVAKKLSSVYHTFTQPPPPTMFTHTMLLRQSVVLVEYRVSYIYFVFIYFQITTTNECSNSRRTTPCGLGTAGTKKGDVLN
eukprot:GEMP01116183.1.p1 GENE.GEMP01116183.1~~GEMP01116183.1.p1  ORF type:complete len:155 (-),score=3.19 GEMP01116183.1:63-527(-)